ncbi:S-layer homology domain-containing protein [Pelotomaculum sp. PtaB.Bin117]|uniref:S-layer homology domain-containing protein n=1 Tax=Pelotomaculum sp. PtaB.Bin117 TaxID=1811694 RepID=UPI0009D09FED|nr:S-layer homology domain-containing protein [Pelotomaculum sp. PtaB.Bin117]OPX88931.1 MAG: Endoglucanase precursor [Pelotomaculum sp. PtaB.Bin117]
MKQKICGILLVSLIAVALFSGGLSGISVAEGVYLPIPGSGVSEYVYNSTAITKGWTKLSAINKNVEINFGKDNYLLFNNTPSGTGIGVFVRDQSEQPTNDSTNWNGCFAQSLHNPVSSPPVKTDYLSHTNDWIVTPISPVYTIVPSSSLPADGSGYSFVSPSAITLKYSSNISDLYDTVSVLYRVYDNSAWEVLPGLVNTSSKTVTATFAKDGFGSYCVANMDSNFSDFNVASVAWSQQYVQSLWNKGIMSQTGSGGYFGLVDATAAHTEYNTTRAEFASMLVKGLRLPLAGLQSNMFSDIGALSLSVDGINYDYFYPKWREYACTAANYGLFNGIRNGATLEFQPDQPVTREQAAALITRALNLKVDYVEKDDDKVLAALTKLYEDASSISVWARPYVLAVSKAKYMSGEPITGTKKYNFDPAGDITRAETAKIIQKLLKSKKLI